MSVEVPTAPITTAQRWVMAIPWHAVMRWDVPWDRFGLVPRPARSAEAARTLEREYGIVTRHDVERSLASLTASANVRDAAWHLSNAVLIAELAYAAFLLEEARAWEAAVDAARVLQECHRGWFSMAEAYLRGLGMYRPDTPDPAAREFLIDLHARPESPWNMLDWNTTLPDILPPPLPELRRDGVFAIDDAAGLERTLAAHPGAHIRLGPGRYRGSFRLRDHVLERAPHTPLGSVVIEAEGGPALVTEGGVWVRGLILQDAEGSPGGSTLSVDGTFARVEDCRFEGGLGGITVAGEAGARASGAAADRRDEPVVQLESLVFEGLSDSAVTLTGASCRARDVAISAVGGSGFSLEQAALHLEDAFIETVDRAGVIARGGAVMMKRVRIHDAERWGVAVSGGARLELHDSEMMRSIVGLCAAGGSFVVAERCRFADSATANVELLDIGSARFSDCHITGGEWSGVWLHPGHETIFRGGQIGGSRQACLMIEGGRDIALSGIGIGPSREGGGLFVSGGAEVHADGVFVSGAALAGVELRASKLVTADLRVRGSVEGVLVRDGARLEGHRLDLAEIAGSGLWLAGGSSAVAGLGLRKVGFGVVAGGGAVALVQNLVAAHTPVVVQVEGGRAALAGRITLGAGVLRVKRGQLAARGLHGITLSASDAELYLEGGSAGSTGAIDVEGSSRVVLVGVELTSDALLTTPDTALIDDAVTTPASIESPLIVMLEPERFAYWGATPTTALLLRVARAISNILGLDTLSLRETVNGVRIDGPLTAMARLTPMIDRVFKEPGALGVLLAGLLSGPRQQMIMPGGPRGLA